jgi:hypothetical protein
MYVAAAGCIRQQPSRCSILVVLQHDGDTSELLLMRLADHIHRNTTIVKRSH